MNICIVLSVSLFTLLLRLTTPVYSQDAPLDGCQAVSSYGSCFSYYAVPSSNREHCQTQCEIVEKHLATITSDEDVALTLDLITANSYCWIGLNDIQTEGTHLWEDGTALTYDKWANGQPNNFGDCVGTSSTGSWYDVQCSKYRNCYFCSTQVLAFGVLTDSNTLQSLPDNSVLTVSSTLYCLTENKNTPEVIWTYRNLDGVSTIVNSTTNETTGVSTLYASIQQPGYYSCDVTQNGGINKTYTVAELDPAIHTVTGAEETYTYTIGVDRNEILLFCNHTDNKIDSPNILWRDIDSVHYSFQNPLSFSAAGNLFKFADSHTFECWNTCSNQRMWNGNLTIQGPPVLTLDTGTIETFTSLTSEGNRAEINAMTKNVKLTINLDGDWQIPDSTSVEGNILTLSSFELANEGIYKFYIRDWDGKQQTAIQIELSLPEPITETTTSTTTLTTNNQPSLSTSEDQPSVSTATQTNEFDLDVHDKLLLSIIAILLLIIIAIFVMNIIVAFFIKKRIIDKIPSPKNIKSVQNETYVMKSVSNT